MRQLLRVATLWCIVIAGGFLFLLGAIGMTGARFDNAGDIAIFLGWNGAVLAIVTLAVRQLIARNDGTSGNNPQ